MTNYSGKQVLAICFSTAMFTAAALVIFRFSFGPGFRADLGIPPPACFSTWPVPLDMGTPRAQTEVRQRYEGMVAQRKSVLTPQQQDGLMRLVANQELWKNMYWLGVPSTKTPSDMWMMQQILAEIRPDYVIETGTMTGGSALYYAHVLQGLGLEDSKVITIDIRDTTEGAAKHPIWQEMVEFVHASSTDPAVIEMISEKVSGKRVVVTLDSLHDAYHVLEELKLYSPLVSSGSYIVAEDTFLDSIPLYPPDWAGPSHAVIEFLDTDAGAGFEADIAREAFPATLHPGGWLRKK